MADDQSVNVFHLPSYLTLCCRYKVWPYTSAFNQDVFLSALGKVGECWLAAQAWVMTAMAADESAPERDYSVSSSTYRTHHNIPFQVPPSISFCHSLLREIWFEKIHTLKSTSRRPKQTAISAALQMLVTRLRSVSLSGRVYHLSGWGDYHFQWFLTRSKGELITHFLIIVHAIGHKDDNV